MKIKADLTTKEALGFMMIFINLKSLRSIYVATDIARDEDKVELSLIAEDLDNINLLSASFADGGDLNSWQEKFKKI